MGIGDGPGSWSVPFWPIEDDLELGGAKIGLIDFPGLLSGRRILRFCRECLRFSGSVYPNGGQFWMLLIAAAICSAGIWNAEAACAMIARCSSV